MTFGQVGRRAVQQALKAAAAQLPAPTGTVVLIYHRVGEAGGEMALAPGAFERQLAHLEATGRVVSLDAAVAALGEGVVLTFDDGTADIVEAALPILVQHRLPMTVYVATKFVEEQLEFPGEGRPISWEGLRECLSTGLVTVGSHTHSHRLLDRATPSDAADELDRSVGLIEDRLGVTPRHFAYPKALAARGPVEEAVRSRFVTAAIAGTRPNRRGRTDLHRLQRSPIQRSDGMRYFEAKVQGRMRLEDDVRRLANRVRYRGRTD